MSLKDGLKLQINHYGCAHYGLAIEFKAAPQAAESGLALLKEAAGLLGRLAEADPESRAPSFLATVEQGLERPSYHPGDPLMETDGYSWVMVNEMMDPKGQRWVVVAYDVAL